VLARSDLEPDGLAEFPLEAGGVCRDADVVVSIFVPDDVHRTSVASPDQNGDRVVGTADRGILEPKVGTSDPTGDLDRDGAVTAADLAILDAHLGHRWLGATRASRHPWGRVKLRYR
jgi:hypothetical protein